MLSRPMLQVFGIALGAWGCTIVMHLAALLAAVLLGRQPVPVADWLLGAVWLVLFGCLAAIHMPKTSTFTARFFDDHPD